MYDGIPGARERLNGKRISLTMRYRFTARSVEGETKSGYLEALDPTEARRQLERRKLQLLQLDVEESAAPVHVAVKSEARPSPPPPKRPLRENGLWSQIDRRKMMFLLVSMVVSFLVLSWAARLFLGEKTYKIQLTGHLALISKQELDADYMDRVQLGLRLQQPAWQINRNGTIGEKGSDGRYHSIGEKAKVQFESTADGDYQFNAEVGLPSAPTALVFFVEAPGFMSRWMEVKLTPGKEPASLVGALKPMTVKRQKRRASVVGGAAQPTPGAPATSSLPKYDPDAPEPLE